MISKPKYRIGRRLGAAVFEKCQTQKFAVSEGKKGRKKSMSRPKALSDFGQQLLEKQKIRYSYGITAGQLTKYVNEATATKGASTPTLLYEKLESRLDNTVYRLGIAHTRAKARQLCSHGHILVNGKRTMVPSYHTVPGDVITIRVGSQASPLFQNMAERTKDVVVPKWLTMNVNTMTGDCGRETNSCGNTI
jgi:small subunit ribosomal protein S4